MGNTLNEWTCLSPNTYWFIYIFTVYMFTQKHLVWHFEKCSWNFKLDHFDFQYYVDVLTGRIFALSWHLFSMQIHETQHWWNSNCLMQKGFQHAVFFFSECSAMFFIINSLSLTNQNQERSGLRISKLFIIEDVKNLKPFFCNPVTTTH